MLKGKRDKGFGNFSDPKYKFWIRYFTQPAEKKESILKTPYKEIYNSFNYKTVDAKVIQKKSKDVEANPEIELPILLHLTETISPAYFKMAETILNCGTASKDKGGEIIEFMIPHFMRFAIAYIYQFELHFINIQQNFDEKGFPLDYVNKFCLVNEILFQAKEEEFADYYTYLLKGFMAFLQTKMEGISTVPQSNALPFLVHSLVDTIIQFQLKQSKLEEKYYPFVEFSTSYLSFSAISRNFDIEYLILVQNALESYSKSNIDNSTVISQIASMIIYSLLNLLKHTTLEITSIMKFGWFLFKFVTKITKLAFVTNMPKPFSNVDMFIFSKTIVDFLYLIFCAFMKEEEPEFVPKKAIVYDEEPFDPNNTTFISNKLVEKVDIVPEPDKIILDIMVPIVFEKSVDAIALYSNLKAAFSIHPELQDNILLCLIDILQKKLYFAKKLYFSMSILTMCDPTRITTLFDQKKMWHSVINEQSLSSMVKYKDDLLNMSEKLLWISFKHSQRIQNDLFEALANFMHTNFLPDVLLWFKRFLIVDPQKFVQSIENTTFIDFLYHIDARIKKYLIEKGEQKDLKDIRTSIFSIIFKITQTSGINQLYCQPDRCKYIFSLIFECPIQNAILVIIQSALSSIYSQMVVDLINRHFFASLKDISDPNWEKLLDNLMMSIELSLKKNTESICFSFVKSSSLTSYQKIALASKNFAFTKRILEFLTNLCCASQYFTGEIGLKQWNFHETWKTVLSREPINDDIVKLLKKLTFLDDEKLIRNPVGLKLLFSVTEPTPYFKDIFSLIKQLCTNSLINRFNSSLADLSSSLLAVYKTKGDESFLELVKFIGSSYFSPNEMTDFIKMIQDSYDSKSLSILETLNFIVDNNNNSKMKEASSFFHIDGSKTLFSIESIKLAEKFSLSFDIRFDPVVQEDKIVFCTISNEKQNITIIFDKLKLIITVDQNSYEASNVQLAPLKWINLNLSFHKKHLFVFKDNEKCNEFKFTKKFVFTPITAKLQITGAVCDIENISFTDSHNNVIARYTAHVTDKNVCPNIASQGTSSNDAAYFNGFSVPYTLRIANIITNLGGIKVILPLFNAAQDSVDCEQYILLLLKFVFAIAKNFEELLIDQQFFRALSDILTEEIGSDSFQCFCEIYKITTSKELRVELLQHIFFNFTLIQRLSTAVHKNLLIHIYPKILAVDHVSFVTINPAKSLIVAFESITLDDSIYDLAWAFIEKVIYISFNEIDAIYLFSAASNTPNHSYTKSCLNVITSLVTSAYISDKGYVPKAHYFPPFYNILYNYEEDFYDMVFNIFNIISSKYSESRLSNYITETFQIFSTCFSMMRNTSNNNMIDIVTKYIFSNKNSVIEIENSQFIPLVCFILHYYENNNQQQQEQQAQRSPRVIEVIQKIKDSLEKSENSVLNMAKCEHWPFWLMLLSNFDDDYKPWVSIIASVSNASNQKLGKGYFFEEIDSVFDIFSYAYDVNLFSEYKGHFIRSLIKFEMSPPIINELFKYLYFMPKKLNARTKPPLTDRLDVTKLAKYIAENCYEIKPPVTFVFKINCDSSQKWADQEIAKHLLNFCLEVNKDFCNSKNIGKESLSGLVIVALTIHMLSTTNREEAKVYLDHYLNLSSAKNNKKILALLQNDFRDDPERLKLIKKFLPENQTESIDVLAIMSEESTTYQEQFNLSTKRFVETITELLKSTYDITSIKASEIPEFETLSDDFRDSCLRLTRQNHQIWRSLMSDLTQNGIIWSNESNKMIHWKFDPTIDSIGRKMKMKMNKNFNDHKDASMASRNIASPAAGQQSGGSPFGGGGGPFGGNPMNKSVKRASFVMNTPKENSVNREFKLQKRCTMVTVTSYYRGNLYITTSKSVVFESTEKVDEFGVPSENCSQKIVEIPYSSILFAMKRRYLHEDNGAELFTIDHKSYFFFFDGDNRRSVLKELNKTFHSKQIEEKTKLWKIGKITNYEYIYWLNMCSGRSFNDVAQYPVFPWVLKNYVSETIDLQKSDNYRDLSLPIGAINPERLANLKLQLKETADAEHETCLYRIHYSSPAFINFFLVRCEPFTTLHISLQKGKFDDFNRLFASIPGLWNMINSPLKDYRELIPEFFSTHEFLLNSEKYDLGDKVDNVVLPPWAKSAINFIVLNRIALESSYVSKSLHNWIDLIFGFKQQDLNANNLFHPYCDHSALENWPENKPLIQEHAANLGVNPFKLFKQSHLKRAFEPFTPQFCENQQTISFTVIAPHEVNAMKMWISQTSSNTLCYVDMKGVIKSAPLDKQNIAFSKFATISMKYSASLAQKENISNFAAVVPSRKYIVISNPWNESFDVFDINESKFSGGGKALFTSLGQPANITAIAADNDIVVSATQDASLVLWSIEKKRMIASLHAHSHKAITVDYSADIDLIASADISGKLSFSSAITCSFIRSIELNDVPTKVMISTFGIVFVFFEMREDLNDVTTLIRAYDLSQREIAEVCRIPGHMTSSCICEFTDCSQYLFVAMSTLKVHMLEVSTFGKVACGSVNGQVDCCTFSKEKHTLYASLLNGDLLSYQFL